jgi:hypothetical protein
MVYCIHSMLYTICYARRTTVCIIGIYYRSLNDIYVCIRIYHGMYHNHFSSFISHKILVPSSPPCAVLFSSPLQRLNCSLASFSQSFPTPLLSFCYSDPVRLPLPIEPHPEVELIEPASVATSPHAGICSSSSPVPKAVGQDGMCVAADIARHQWHTSQHISALQIYRLGRLVPLAESKNIGTPLHCMTELGVSLMGSKVLKKTREGELSLSCFVLQLPDGSNSTVEEQLYWSIPQKAFSAEIHVSPGHVLQKVCSTLPYWQSVKNIQIGYKFSQILTNKFQILTVNPYAASIYGCIRKKTGGRRLPGRSPGWQRHPK